ncbi:glycosyl hydrolase [Capsulimonas corticalis]|uniref:beta-glucosidase n=1 Tax=Capsulimonas corticalis TaxID=2219043 RepID=A0A402CWW0_9BACT|nr:glycoside hydrolase family 3 N-terminal domain-containing protein [Capsulimonas corticalis]BDI34306.1 glycosyl hydrolase [Capsulimonas corticalis]
MRAHLLIHDRRGFFRGVAVLTLLGLPAFARGQALAVSPFSAQVEKQAAEMRRKMTLEEKVGQLVQFPNGGTRGPDGKGIDQNELVARGGVGSLMNPPDAGAVNAFQKQAVEKSRMKIPVIVAMDVIHGYRTIFPVPLALSASWDPGLVEKTSRVAAVEATSEGIRWTFSPMVDIARDARWGRIMEGAGEDPYLGALFAAAAVRGYQGKDLSDPTSMVACVKHFVAYGGAESGRDYNAVDMSDRTLRDVYFPPFQAAVDAGAGSLMSAFSSLQGVPASANHDTLTDVLRGEWGFRGFVVSDWNSVGELINHGVALDGETAARKAVTAGVDMDMGSGLYGENLVKLVRSGKVPERAVDEAVERILRVKIAMGLFSHPYTDETRSKTVLLAPEHVALARRAAEESFVLLKNDPISGGAPALPLADGKTVALIGPLADSAGDMLGGWEGRGQGSDVVTLKQALAGRLKDKLVYAKGTEIETDSEAGFHDALDAANRADVVVMALGESRGMTGEAASRTKLDLPGNQLKLLEAVAATGKPVVLVLFSGRPLALPWEAAHLPAILEAWFPGVQAGPALVDTLYGESNPAGKLTASFPRSVGQEPLYYSVMNTGRPVNPGNPYVTRYIDELTTAQFPFGWGLSYTKFDYSPTKITTPAAHVKELNGGAAITVEATVTNSGARAGEEIAQLYIRERGTSVVRPIRELKGYQKILLKAGESRLVRFMLTKRELGFWNIDRKQTVEPCELTVWVAPHSEAGQSSQMTIAP